jgi:hypothetical protein
MALKSFERPKFVTDRGPLATSAAPVSAPELASQPRQRVSKIPPSREGLVPFSFFVPPEARRQIKGWAALNGRSTQDIGQEMMNDWCAKHGLHRLVGSKGDGQ